MVVTDSAPLSYQSARSHESPRRRQPCAPYECLVHELEASTRDLPRTPMPAKLVAPAHVSRAACPCGAGNAAGLGGVAFRAAGYDAWFAAVFLGDRIASIVRDEAGS